MRAKFSDVSQLQLKDFVRQALAQHYGERAVPNYANGAIIRRKDYFSTKFVDGTTARFFDRVDDGGFTTNLKELSAPNQTLRILLGMQVLEDASDDGTGTIDVLDFDELVTTAIRQGTFSIDVNGNEFMKDNEIDHLFTKQGIEAVDGYFMFDKPVVWENNEQFELTFRFLAAPDKWIKVNLITYELTANTGKS